MLDVDASYTFTNSHYISTTTGDPIGAQLGAVPKHLGTMGVTWQATPKWHAFVGARHTDAMFLDVNHTIQQPSFTLFNASTSYQFAKQLEAVRFGDEPDGREVLRQFDDERCRSDVGDAALVHDGCASAVLIVRMHLPQRRKDAEGRTEKITEGFVDPSVGFCRVFSAVFALCASAVDLDLEYDPGDE